VLGRGPHGPVADSDFPDHALITPKGRIVFAGGFERQASGSGWQILAW
jgi:hypothetical protein